MDIIVMGIIVMGIIVMGIIVMGINVAYWVIGSCVPSLCLKMLCHSSNIFVQEVDNFNKSIGILLPYVVLLLLHHSHARISV